jgi:hypothetical protein
MGARPEGFEIEDSAVVDAGVGRCLAPCAPRRIGAEGTKHVFVNELLQIEAERVAAGADYDICTDARGTRHISVWAGKANVSRIVAGRNADLSAGCCGNAGALAGRQPGSEKGGGKTAEEISAQHGELS